MRDGIKITSPLQFDIVNGQLLVIDPLDDDDDSAIPF
jgi:hypothetical protein